jgi:decaprenylphospho-beta-D-ribofuranose 2-oxidase
VSTLLTGWGRTAPTRADVVRPEGVEDVAAALAGGRPVIARGLGRAYGDAAQNAGGLVVDVTGLDAIHAFDPEAGVIDAGAGLDLDSLIRHVLPDGWFVPVTPGTRHVTLGGALAADVHGKNHHVDGSFSRHVEAFELVTPGGEVREVRPDDELFRATAGGMGLTGVVTRVRLRLLPVTSAHMRVTTHRARDLDALMTAMRERDSLYRYSVAWIDCLKRGAGMGRGVVLWGEHATAEELPEKLRRDPLAYRAGTRLAVPDLVPGGVLNGIVARAFNEAYFRRAPAQERIGLEPLGPYFHPLDAVAAWNRLYGPRGFVQYQAVVPDDAEDAVRALLERVSGTGTSSFLAVLKRFGEGTGMLSFPMPGWTLALDIPVGDPELARRLDELDDVVAGAGGRVYLAKDARVRPETLAAMYPDLERWREIQRRIDPEGIMRSDLSQRLGLT